MRTPDQSPSSTQPLPPPPPTDKQLARFLLLMTFGPASITESNTKMIIAILEICPDVRKKWIDFYQGNDDE